MKQKLWLTLVNCLAYCIDKELYKAIDYLREQVRVLIEHQEKENKRILLGRIIKPKHPIDDTAEIVCVERLDGSVKKSLR